MFFPQKNQQTNKNNKKGRGKRKLLEVMDMFSILMVVTVSQVYAYLQTHPTVHTEYVQIFGISIIPQSSS